jgi:hypothetical protein
MNKPITSFYMNRKDGTMLVITRPTNNCYIRQVETGQLYAEAIDVGYYGSDYKYHASKYTYEETNEVIEDDKSENN